LTLNGGSSLSVQLAGTTPSSEHDQLAVTGTAMLGGTMEVSLLNGFAPARDDAFVILTAGNVIGTFDDLLLPALAGDLAWKVLYETDSVSLISYLPGDFNRDRTTDAADYVMWRKTLGQMVTIGSGADSDFDGQITQADYDMWRANFGRTSASGAGALAGKHQSGVPEPSILAMTTIGLSVAAACRWQPQRRSL
jgi:hypothetical protein